MEWTKESDNYYTCGEWLIEKRVDVWMLFSPWDESKPLTIGFEPDFLKVVAENTSKHIKIIVPFWQSNEESFDFSTMYTEEWVEKLYRAVERNLDMPFEFICITDKPREFSEPNICQTMFKDPDNIGYHSCIECFQWGGPAIVMGLDTVITGDITPLAEYCMKPGNKMALPIDPNFTRIRLACNGITLLPPGHEEIYLTHEGQNDMEWQREFPHVFIDDIFPWKVKSYKKHVKKRGLGKCSIVFFHGLEKPHEIEEDFVREHWK